ncbi:MAG: ribonuclease H-like domain-containing protein [Chloroflexota bacterium]
MNPILFFDLETQKTFDDVGGRHNTRQLGLSVGVTYNTLDQAYHVYTEADVTSLVRDLSQAELVVGFNVIRFDYEVLRAYSEHPFEQIPTIDMLDHIHRALGFRVSLDSLASATLGAQKSADGLAAVRWYKSGQIDKIIEYCKQDVKVTKELYEFGRQNGFVQFLDRSYRLKKAPVRW